MKCHAAFNSPENYIEKLFNVSFHYSTHPFHINYFKLMNLNQEPVMYNVNFITCEIFVS